MTAQISAKRNEEHVSRNWLLIAIMVAVIGLYIGLRIWSLWTPHLWGDEVFSFSLSQGSWLTLFKRAGLDMIHPPLFYFPLKLWIYVTGSSVPGLRILPVMFSIVSIVPLIILGRKLSFQMPVIVLTLALAAVNNYLILYSYYLRSNSLLLLLSLSSQAVFVMLLRSRSTNQKQTLVALTLVNIVFVYTHYFAWFMIVGEYLWILVRDRKHLRSLTFATAIIVLSYLPWIGVIVYVSTQVSYTFLDKLTWYYPPGVRSLLLLFRCFQGGFNSTALTLTGSFIVLVIVLAGLKNFSGSDSKDPNRERNLNPYTLLLWLSAFPIISSEVVGRIFTWKWEPRYLILVTGSYLLLVSASAFSLRNHYLRALAIVFLLAWSSIAGFTDNLAEVLHGPDGPSLLLARDLSQKEPRNVGPINIYGLSPYVEQGLRLALNLTGERRFQTKQCAPDVTLSDDYFWLAVAEHDPIAMARVTQLSSGQLYDLGERLYRGEYPERHILIPVRRRNLFAWRTSSTVMLRRERVVDD